MSKLETLLIVIIFYTGWFGCVFLARTEYSYLSFLFPFALIGFLQMKSFLRKPVFVLALLISCIGILFDFLLIRFEFVSTQGQSVFGMPLWLISIWFLFSLSMIPLGTRFAIPMWLAAVLGFFMGPLSYKSGEFFEVLTLASTTTLFVYAVFWSVMFPGVLTLSKRFT